MAQRDLDAALQLLADRAQYITGASGAAIALRRDGRNDMLCRASTGPNAPELGALLSTEFGLSGESVRTRQVLRCDDAARDARVNREVCRQLGIASVVVMPVVHDDQVLGVFELFSGKANAFGERDLSAVRRLSEMVETAVRLAHVTETLPEQLKSAVDPAATASDAEFQEGQFLSDLVVEEVVEAPAPPAVKAVEEAPKAAAEVSPLPPLSPAVEADPILPANVVAQHTATPQVVSSPASIAEPAPTNPPKLDLPKVEPQEDSQKVDPPKKVLFWSAALDTHSGDSATPAGDDQSHVPPVLRGLRKCEACGFPVSAGRVLCVECEEKKWRGQLRTSAARPAPVKPTVPVPLPSPSSAPRSAAPASAAAPAPAASMAKATPAFSAPSLSAAQGVKAQAVKVDTAVPVSASARATVQESKKESGLLASSNPDSTLPVASSEPLAPSPKVPELVFSAGLGPSQSWLSRNKYVVGVLLVVAAGLAAVFLLR